MPDDHIRYLQEHLDRASEVFVPADDKEINGLALIHALRMTSDALSRLAEQQKEANAQQVETNKTLHGMDKRLATIEQNNVDKRVQNLELDMVELKAERERRRGAVGIFEWFAKSWPAIVLLVTLLVFGIIGRGKV